MQKYVLVKFIGPVADGTEFSAADWPLHVTLASNFAVDWEGTNLLAKLSELLKNHRPVAVTVRHDEYFGPQKQVHVTTLEMTGALRSLHNDIIALLKSAGAVFDEPIYLEAGYRAHATVRLAARLHDGDRITIDDMTIVDMFPGGDIKRRKALQTLLLNN